MSAAAGYGLAKYTFIGKQATFNVLLAGVLVPSVVLVVPQYLLLAKLGLTNPYWAAAKWSGCSATSSTANNLPP